MTRDNTLYILALFIGIPICLSAFFFMGQSLRLDEAQSLWQTSRSVGDIFTIVAGDVHVPFYHVILHYWRIAFGDSVAVARTFSLLFFCASIPALYLLGKSIYGKTTALFASFLFAISPFMNWYANEIRMYTLFTLLVILNQYFFIRIWRSQGETLLWLGYATTALLGVFVHYFFFLNLIAQAVFYFLNRDLFPKKSLRNFILSAIVVCGVFLPWGLYVLHVGTASFQRPVLAVPTTVNLFSAFSEFLFGLQNDNINTFFLSLWPIAAAAAFLSLRRNRRMQPETEYLILTVVLSFGIAFFGSFVVAPVFVSRYLIFTIPALYLLLATLFSGFSINYRNYAGYGFATIMLITLGIEIISPTMPAKENYAQAVSFLNEYATPQDTIVLSAPFTIYPVQYYYRGPASVATLPVWNQYAYGAIPIFDETKLSTEVRDATGASQNAYLLLSYDQGYEKNIKDYFDSHYEQLYEQHFSQDLNLYVYRLRYDTGKSAVKTAFNNE